MQTIFTSLRTLWRRGALVLCFSMMLSAAQAKVDGVVTDASGLPLVGVTVMVNGTSIGTVTDVSGKYSIDAEGGATLDFAYLGMESVSKLVGPQVTSIDVALVESVASIGDVVVVGYGTQTKVSLTSAIAQVSSEEILKTPTTNLTQGLSAMLPGIQSVQSSGQPGSDSASITLRGSSYGVTYIVDGVPRSIDEIDPNDVESISLLKDGAAAAVYGLNSAGGVIIVTTKRGRKGPSTITYRGSLGVSMNTSYPEFLDGPGYAYWYNTALEMDGYEPIFTNRHVEMMTNGDSSDGWGNTNWIDETFGVGRIQQHSVTSQGGNDKTTYFASFGYMDQQGNIDNFNYDRYNLRSNINTNLAHGLDLSLNIAGILENTDTPGFSSGGSNAAGETWLSIAQQAAYAHPYLPMTQNGLYTASQNSAGNVINPIAAINESGLYKTQTLTLQSSATLNWQIPWVKGLSAKVMGSYDRSFTTNKNLSTPYSLMLASTPTSVSTDIKYTEVADPRTSTSTTLTEGYSQWVKATTQSSLNYKNRFVDHGIEAMLLLETRDYKTNYISASAQDLAIPELPELTGNGATDLVSGAVDGASSANRSVGLVMRAKYDYMNRYYFEFTGRYDGSYKFAGNVAGSRWGFFPSVSAAWRISEENFFEPARTVVDDFKIRASFGTLGSDNVTPFSYLSTFTNQYTYPSVVINGVGESGLMTSVVSNPFLTWEQQHSYNLGVDVSMWDSKLAFTADVFYTYVFDILGATAGMPDSMGGYYPTYSNNNSRDSRGFEVSISHNNKVGEFTYGVTVAASYSKSRWLVYQDAASTQSWACWTGADPNMTYGMVADGLFQSEEEIDNSPYFTGSRPSVGDIKYVDLNGDGVISYEQDRGLVGRGQRPKVSGSITLSGAWKGLDFNALFIGAGKSDVSLMGTYYNWSDDSTVFSQAFKGGANAPVYLVENSWTPDNTDAQFPRLSTQFVSNNSYASTFWFRDGKYMRLKSAQIGYTLPVKWVNYIGLGKVRIYCEGQNLFTLSGLPEGIDPEWPDVSNGYYPQQRTVIGGVEVSF